MDEKLAELEHVRTVYENWSKETAVIERFALVTTGAIWSWCASKNATDNAVLFVVWVPTFLCMLFGWRARIIRRDMLIAEDYLMALEKDHFSNAVRWQNKFKEKSSKRRAKNAFLFWVILIITTAITSNVVIGYLLYNKLMPGNPLSIVIFFLLLLATIIVLGALELKFWHPKKWNKLLKRVGWGKE